MTVMTKRLRPLRRTGMTPAADPLAPATLSASVNRQTFREILAARLDGVLQFGRTCTGFEQDPGGVAIHFSDGPRAEAEILVGAEGIELASPPPLPPARPAAGHRRRLRVRPDAAHRAGPAAGDDLSLGRVHCHRRGPGRHGRRSTGLP